MKSLVQVLIENFQRFLIGGLLGGAAFAGVVGGCCYLLVRDEAPWRLAIVAVLVVIGTLIAVVVFGARLAATETVRLWVQSLGVGPMLSKVIFKQALGVSDKRPQGSKEVAAALEGATLADAKAMLSGRLGDLFSGDSLDRWLPSQGRWIAKRLTSAAGWAVTRSLLDELPTAAKQGDPVNLLALRDGLADGLSEKAVGLVTARATVLGLALVAAAAGVCLLAATLLGVAF